MNLREKQVGAISDLSDGPWAVELICSFACDRSFNSFHQLACNDDALTQSGTVRCVLVNC